MMFQQLFVSTILLCSASDVLLAFGGSSLNPSPSDVERRLQRRGREHTCTHNFWVSVFKYELISLFKGEKHIKAPRLRGRLGGVSSPLAAFQAYKNGEVTVAVASTLIFRLWWRRRACFHQQRLAWACTCGFVPVQPVVLGPSTAGSNRASHPSEVSCSVRWRPGHSSKPGLAPPLLSLAPPLSWGVELLLKNCRSSEVQLLQRGTRSEEPPTDTSP